MPDAVINSFYSAMKKSGGISRVLAQHVEGASQWPKGIREQCRGISAFVSARRGRLARTNYGPLLGLGRLDSDSRHHRSGIARPLVQGRLSAVDIESIAKPVTKWAVTVHEPLLVPRVFQQAFHLMRLGRPVPVLVDLPIDVQLAEIEFDIDTVSVYKPKATCTQIEKALSMLNDAEKPLIVSGGGVLNAVAEDLLVQLAETLGVPVIPTLMFWGAIPDDHPLMAACTAA